MCESWRSAALDASLADGESRALDSATQPSQLQVRQLPPRVHPPSPSTATSSSVGDASFAAWTRGFDDPSATASEEALLPPYLSDMSLIEVAERYGTPLYVYNFDAVAKQVRLRSSIAVRHGHNTTLLSRTIASD